MSEPTPFDAVVLAGGAAERQQPAELVIGLVDLGLLRAVAAQRGQPGGFDLDAHADFEHVESMRYLFADLGANGAEGQHRARDDEDAGPLTRFDQPVGGKRGDRLAHDGAADAEGLRQPAFGRQARAGRKCAGAELGAQFGDNSFGQLRPPFAPAGPVTSVGKVDFRHVPT